MLSFYRSDLGKKAVMAVTGVMFFGFVLGHMFGNLKLYLGAEALNHYAEWLRALGEPLLPHGVLLWIIRVVLLVAVGLHVMSATLLTLKSRRARSRDFQGRDTVQATYASRTMVWGGVILALFIFYHLAHFTWGPGWAHPDFVPGDVYHNVVAGFSVWWISALYIVAQLALGLHLYHGLWSMFQSLGWYTVADPHDWRRRFAQVFALVIVAGNISFPLAVLSGLVG